MWKRLRNALFLALGLWFLWQGAQSFLLLSVGVRKQATVENAVSSWGARNRVFTVYYILQAGGREWRGSGSATRRVSPGAGVPVRYLELYPGVNGVDSSGAMVLWGCVWSALSVPLILLNLRALTR